MSAILSKPRDSLAADAHYPPVPVPSFEEDEFPHGWRRITETLPDGSVRYHDIPLSPEDFLNPEYGDQMPQGFEHSIQAVDIYNKLRKHYHGSPGVKVLFDTKIRWGIPDLKEPFPDIAVIPDVGDMEIIEGEFFTVKTVNPAIKQLKFKQRLKRSVYKFTAILADASPPQPKGREHEPETRC